MNLNYTLPDRERSLFVNAHPGQEILYCIPYDLADTDGLFVDGFLAITKTHVIAFMDGALVREWEIAGFSGCKAIVGNGCGLLTARIRGTDTHGSVDPAGNHATAGEALEDIGTKTTPDRNAHNGAAPERESMGSATGGDEHCGRNRHASDSSDAAAGSGQLNVGQPQAQPSSCASGDHGRQAENEAAYRHHADNTFGGATDGFGGYIVLCRYSMRHLERFSYIAKGIVNRIEQVDKAVVSRERETVCPKCGRSMKGRSICRFCDGRSITWKRLGRYFKPFAVPAVFSTLILIAGTVINLSVSFIQRDFVDNHLSVLSGGLRDLLIFCAMMGLALLLQNMLSSVSNVLYNWIGKKFSKQLRDAVYAHLQKLSLSFFNKLSVGSILNRVMGDVDQIERFISQFICWGAFNILSFVGALVAMCVIDLKLAAMSLCLTPFIVVVFRVTRKKMHQIYHKQWHIFDKLNTRLQDVLGGIRVVKSYGKEHEESQAFYKYADEFAHQVSYNEKWWYIWQSLALNLLLSSVRILVLLFGGMRVLSGQFTMGDLMVFQNFVGLLLAPLSFFSFLPRQITWMLNSFDRIGDILDETPDIQDSAAAAPHEIGGHVEVRNVTFGYKSYEPVLKDINLDVRQGEMIGLVGASGSGKSTLINLIMRLYDPDEGDIFIDGVNLRDVSLESLHSQIGVVLQETFLFSGSILDNIRYAKPDATMEEVIRAAKVANAHEFIIKTADGYNTLVGENGCNLSGGERQRIAIARAILSDPKILILDEATSNLDTENEYQIQEALGRLIKGRTTFAIAHRLSTLKNADRLVVIDHNAIAEVGTHNELLRQKGIYYGLVMAQLSMYKTPQAKDA